MADIARIKGNIAKMIAQGAPEADIDAYVSSEGVTIEQLRSSAPREDKYQKAAREEFEKKKAAGVEEGINRRVVQGMTLNAADEILAGLMTPLRMIEHGTFNPIEGYKYAKAAEDYSLDQARKNQGVAGAIAEIGGGVMTGTNLMRGGLTASRFLGPGAGLTARTGASAADAAIFGSLAGGLEGNTLEERGTNAAIGGALGGAFGAAVPVATAVGGAALSPVISNIRARVNPQGYARTQVARGITESGRPVDDIVDDVSRAAQEGQGMFTLADAMGNPGQRMLSSVARAPGAGRTAVTEFLEQRQAGQGRRVASALADGFDAPQTAAQTRTRLTSQRGAEARVNYGQARADAGSVNVTPAIEAIDDTLRPGVNRILPETDIADNSVEGALRRARSYLTDGDSQISSFDDAFMAKRELDAMIDTAPPTVQRVLIPVRNALDDQLASASQSYRAARDTFRRQSQAIEAIDTGRDSAMRGRTEDTIPRFRGMEQEQQAGFRAGYADPLIEQAQGAAFGVNKARPLTSDAFRDEAAVMAPGNQLMQRRLGRENAMFETRAHALGGSRTADNLADEAAMGIDPSIIGNVLSGNWGGALRSAISAGGRMLSGNTPEVREEVARILLQRGQNLSPQNLRAMVDETVRRIELVRKIASQLGRGAAGGLAVAPGAVGARR